MKEERETLKTNVRLDRGELSPVVSSNRGFGHSIISIVIISFSLLLLLSLISFHISDPGFFSLTDIYEPPKNIVGPVGSYLADLFIALFGYVSFIIPIIFIANVAFSFISAHKIGWLRNMGTFIFFITLCASATGLIGGITITQDGMSAEFGAGGEVGRNFLLFLQNLFNITGAAIILAMLLMLSALLILQNPILVIVGKINNLLSPLINFIKVILEKRREKLKRNEVKAKVIKSIEEEPVVRKQDIDIKEITPQNKLPFTYTETQSQFQLPPTSLLDPPSEKFEIDEGELREKASLIRQKLAEFDIIGNVTEIHPGPVVTIFEYKPAPGIKYSRVTGMEEDLSMALKAEHIRIDRIGGKSSIGIEIPNTKRELITFKELVESPDFQNTTEPLTLALGKRVDGVPYVTSLQPMPHLLIAGSTGSGKSVGLNTIICSLLYKSTPEEVRLILIDPKKVELGIYADIPHLLCPVVTDVKQAAHSLAWAVTVMLERYKMLSGCSVRDIRQFNQFVKEATPSKEAALDFPLQLMPYIVIIIDELGDLMATVAKEVEIAISRLAMMARAVGIHLILATQRPDRNTITGAIKANLPSRIAYSTRDKIESRIILDQNGSETLQGKGDMLFLPPGSARLIRLHGGFLSDIETGRIIQFLKRQGKPSYDMDVLKAPPVSGDGRMESSDLSSSQQSDPLFDGAVEVVVRTGQASASNLQRKMSIGYARAARLIDIMEERGLIGPADGPRQRKILIKPEDL